MVPDLYLSHEGRGTLTLLGNNFVTFESNSIPDQLKMLPEGACLAIPWTSHICLLVNYSKLPVCAPLHYVNCAYYYFFCFAWL